MSAEVGGRLEAVAPRRSLFLKDYWRIGVLLAVAIAIHGWLVVNTALPARDSIGFARIANNLSDPETGSTTDKPRQRIDVIREAQHPPGHPIVIWMTAKALKPWIDSSRILIGRSSRLSSATQWPRSSSSYRST